MELHNPSSAWKRILKMVLVVDSGTVFLVGGSLALMCGFTRCGFGTGMANAGILLLLAGGVGLLWTHRRAESFELAFALPHSSTGPGREGDLLVLGGLSPAQFMIAITLSSLLPLALGAWLMPR